MGLMTNWFKTHEQYADLREDYDALKADRDFWESCCTGWIEQASQLRDALDAVRDELHSQPDRQEPYRAFVDRLFVKRREDGLLHPVIGMAGEAGELLDAVKKNWAYGKPLDCENVIEELGDLYHYMTMAMIVLGIGLNDVIDNNVAKLKKRYPDGYSDAAAIERKDKA